MNPKHTNRLMHPVVALAAFAALTLCCSSSIAAAVSPTGAVSNASAGPLTGTWSGKYSGAYHGTFTLHWTQSRSQLAGTIKLSSTGGTTSVKGTVHGTTIRFGTVGTAAITYTGSVSGKTMSGSYQTPGGNGSWSAHKAALRR